MPVLPLACHLPHNTPHIPSRYNNEQTTKQTKAINNSYIYINISCKCDTNRAGHFTLDAYASRPVACTSHWDELPHFLPFCRWPATCYDITPTLPPHVNWSRSRQNGRHLADDIIRCIFCEWEILFILFNSQWDLFWFLEFMTLNDFETHFLGRSWQTKWSKKSPRISRYFDRWSFMKSVFVFF